MLSSKRLDPLSAREAAEAVFVPPASYSTAPQPRPLRLSDIAKLADMRGKNGHGSYGQAGGFDSANWWGF